MICFVPPCPTADAWMTTCGVTVEHLALKDMSAVLDEITCQECLESDHLGFDVANRVDLA